MWIESSGPAFGVALHEMPGNAWCTSLIGGQKHELPLVVFTVIEEIYRRGEMLSSLGEMVTDSNP